MALHIADGDKNNSSLLHAVMIDNVRSKVKPLSVNLDNTAAGKNFRG